MIKEETMPNIKVIIISMILNVTAILLKQKRRKLSGVFCYYIKVLINENLLSRLNLLT